MRRPSLLAVWDFLVGDDWRTAAGVVAAIGATALLADSAAPAWALLPICVAFLLAASLHRAARGSDDREDQPG